MVLIDVNVLVYAHRRDSRTIGPVVAGLRTA